MNITNSDHFTFNLDNSALLVGQTGTGKTELVRRYIRRLERAFTKNEMKYVIFDMKVVEFDSNYEGGAKEEYLLHSVITSPQEGMAYLEELAKLAMQRATGNILKPFIFIYIEECDIAAVHHERFEQAVVTINKQAKNANMKLIFATSRPSCDIITPVLRDSVTLPLY